MFFLDYETVIGRIYISADSNYITGVSFCEPAGEKKETFLIKTACTQLMQYFTGTRKTFDIPIKIDGTNFQKKVWNTLLKIPYGKTICYKELAKICGNEKAARAVGKANNQNKILIIIPCHRVIGKNGDLIGYAGGLKIKKFLLDLETQ